MSVTAHYYSQYVHFDVHYRITPPPGACVKNQYGGYVNNDFACVQFAQNDADWDIRVWQTTGHWKVVYSERDSGIEGQGSTDVFDSDLGLPYGCYAGQHWRRDFKAVFRVFSPLTSRVLKTTSSSWYVSC